MTPGGFHSGRAVWPEKKVNSWGGSRGLVWGKGGWWGKYGLSQAMQILLKLLLILKNYFSNEGTKFLISQCSCVTKQGLCALGTESQTLTAGVWCKVSVYFQGATQEEQGAPAQKTRTPSGFLARVFKDVFMGEGHRTPDQLPDLLLTGWWWDSRWCFENLTLLVPSLGSMYVWSV